jgi:hypothetical protein
MMQKNKVIVVFELALVAIVWESLNIFDNYYMWLYLYSLKILQPLYFSQLLSFRSISKIYFCDFLNQSYALFFLSPFPSITLSSLSL